MARRQVRPRRHPHRRALPRPHPPLRPTRPNHLASLPLAHPLALTFTVTSALGPTLSLTRCARIKALRRMAPPSWLPESSSRRQLGERAPAGGGDGKDPEAVEAPEARRARSGRGVRRGQPRRNRRLAGGKGGGPSPANGGESPPTESVPGPDPSPPPPYAFTDTASLRTAAQEYNADADSATATYGPISSWGVSAITSMSSLFQSLNQFNADISNWDTSGVTDMGNMFQVRSARALPAASTVGACLHASCAATAHSRPSATRPACRPSS